MVKIVIWGAGGFGREVAWLIKEISRADTKYELVGFLDDNITLQGKYINGYPVLGGFHYLQENGNIAIAIALGDPYARLNLFQRLEKFDLEYPNLIHPGVLIGDDVSIGIGNIICAGAILTVNVKMGNFCQLNLKTTVGHDCILGDFTTSACSVDFAGYSATGTGVYLGNQSTLLPSTQVGAFSIVGAGAVVNHDIPAGVVAVGVPAKVIKRNRVYDQVKQTIETLAPDPKSGRAFH